MLTIFCTLWIIAMSYTIWKRGVQIKKVENRIKSYIDEQAKTKEVESQEGEEESNNERGTTEGPG